MYMFGGRSEIWVEWMSGLGHEHDSQSLNLLRVSTVAASPIHLFHLLWAHELAYSGETERQRLCRELCQVR